ncbi:MAG: peptide ABC transporter substrate-binding protein [Candidatus Sericytochromatia bacterium]
MKSVSKSSKSLLGKRILTSLILTGGLLTAAVAPGLSAPSGGVVRIISVGEPALLNPVFDMSPAAGEFYNLIYSGLIQENTRGELEPDLVEVVPTLANGMVKMTAEGGMTVTYKLRPGLKWQDGQPLTADDIMFTWQVHTDPKIKYPPTPGYEQLRRVEIVNAQTAIAHFHRPYGDYYRLFHHLLPRHSFRSRSWAFAPDHPYNRHPVGSGPFALKDWVKGESALLDANPLYHRSRPHLDQIRFQFKPADYNAVKNSLDWTKDAEVMRGLPIASYNYLKNLPDLDLHVVADGQIEYLLFNFKHPALADRRVRRALAFATDRNKISDLLLGLAEPAYSDQLRDSWKYNPQSEKFYAPDPVQAAANLQQAGWQRSENDPPDAVRKKGDQPLSLTLTLEMGNKSHQLVGRYLQQAWKEVGVELKVKTVAPRVMREEVMPAGDYELILGTWTQHPGETPFRRWHSTQVPPLGINYGNFSDYQVDQLTRSLQETVNLPQQKKLYQELGAMIAEQVPVLPLYYGAQLEASRRNLHNYYPNAYMGATWNSYSWWLDQQ